VNTATVKRPYLRAADRRRQLLDGAGRLFDRYGFGGITMAGLAAEARVSRQLVYTHFADLDALYAAFVEDRLARYRAAAPDVASLSRDDAAAALFQQLLTIPPTDRRVIRLLVADVGIRALDRIRRHFLAEELARWDALRASAHGPAVVWATTSALLALADSVDAGDIDSTAANDMAKHLVSAARDVARRSQG
jgi:AcrR family transcriptional regulator